MQIGLVTAIVSTLIGACLGAAAGYFGGWIDHVVTWIYSTFSSIPNLVFLVVLAYGFSSLDSTTTRFSSSSGNQSVKRSSPYTSPSVPRFGLGPAV
ncbi:MAG: hypothetical protein R3B96_03710 [Pirellulaceae bacterium]